jgi:hypothetical protein
MDPSEPLVAVSVHRFNYGQTLTDPRETWSQLNGQCCFLLIPYQGQCKLEGIEICDMKKFGPFKLSLWIHIS